MFGSQLYSLDVVAFHMAIEALKDTMLNLNLSVLQRHKLEEAFRRVIESFEPLPAYPMATRNPSVN